MTREFTIRRRTAVGYLGAAAAAAGLRAAESAAAHGATPVPGTVHGLVGAWLSTTAGGIVLSLFGADGSVTIVSATSAVDATLPGRNQGPALGHWEPIGDHSAYFTAIQVLVDDAGAYAGTRTFEGHPVLSGDHQIYMDEAPQHVIVRDAANAILDDQLVPMVAPIVATRVGASPESLEFPELASASTPTP